jgi:environmental stress-induced protein Ves
MDNRPRIVRLDSLPASPWRNGGGVTRELACAPRAAGRGFAWRISVADIEQPGPFSAFDGYHRRLVLLDGTGLYLASHGQPTARLNLPGDQHVFDGGDAVKATLCAGACRVINIMTAHDVRATWTVRLLRDASVAAIDGAFILLPAQALWRADGALDVWPGTASIRMGHRAAASLTGSGPAILLQYHS